jgi:nicotinate phosphoribosyltransferase
MKRKTKFQFPAKHEPHTDKYFLRSREILQKEDINPTVVYQAFIRKGPGIVNGIDESIAAIMKYRPEFAKNGKIWALNDGDKYESCETLMLIEGPVQDLVDLETFYLSILSERTGKANGLEDPDLEKITNTAREITNILENSKFGPRATSYFGARHFGYEWDAKIARAVYEGGFTAASTDEGAGTFGKKGGGTTPHALLIAFASKYGLENYAVKAMLAFDKHIDESVPRIFLADTFNKEITDTLKVAEALGKKFYGPRFDTNGGVIAEGGSEDDGRKYWTGKGVTIEGVLAAKRAFAKAGYDLNNSLTSGFSNPEKVRAIVEAEKEYGVKLFDFLGAGFADNRYTATSDIVRYVDNGQYIDLHKVGRKYNPNPRLKEVDLEVYRI